MDVLVVGIVFAVRATANRIIAAPVNGAQAGTNVYIRVPYTIPGPIQVTVRTVHTRQDVHHPAPGPTPVVLRITINAYLTPAVVALVTRQIWDLLYDVTVHTGVLLELVTTAIIREAIIGARAIVIIMGGALMQSIAMIAGIISRTQTANAVTIAAPWYPIAVIGDMAIVTADRATDVKPT